MLVKLSFIAIQLVCVLSFQLNHVWKRAKTTLSAEVFDVTIVQNGVSTIIKSNEDETLLESMDKYPKLQPSASCRSGSCASCASKVNDPSGIVHDDEEPIETFKRKQGFIFSCIARVTKPGLVVEINEEEAYNAAVDSPTLEIIKPSPVKAVEKAPEPAVVVPVPPSQPVSLSQEMASTSVKAAETESASDDPSSLMSESYARRLADYKIRMAAKKAATAPSPAKIQSAMLEAEKIAKEYVVKAGFTDFYANRYIDSQKRIAARKAGDLIGSLGISSDILTKYSSAGPLPYGALEVDPYYDQSKIPLNTYKPKEPLTGKIVSVKRVVGPDAAADVREIVIDHGGKMPYWEGQSCGVIPPGINSKTGKAHNNRLYSIASTRYGDDGKGNTLTLCVRRATFVDPGTKLEDPSKKGVCSNFLCDAQPGTEVSIAGPAGKILLLPEDKPNVDLIMVATGTGIAPYRGFLKRLFVEDTPAGRAFKGLAWLFLGVASKDALLYDSLWQDIKKRHPNNFRVDYALSREQTNSKGGKLYIQDKIEEYGDELFSRLSKGAHIYFCGLKGMMPGILETLESVAKRKGFVWEDLLQSWKEVSDYTIIPALTLHTLVSYVISVAWMTSVGWTMACGSILEFKRY